MNKSVRAAPTSGSLRVLHVVTRNQARGAERIALLLTEHLGAYGWNQKIVALFPGGEGDLGIPVLAESRPASIVSLRREITRSRPDVILAHGGTAAALSAVAVLGSPVPVVWQRILEFPSRVWDHRQLRLFWRAVANRCSGVVALTRKAEREMKTLGFSGPTQYIPNHRPLALSHEVRIDKTLAARIGDAQLVLAFIGHLVDQKDPVAAINVAEFVLTQLPHCHLVVVGDGPLAEQVRNAALRSSVQERIHLLGHIDNVRSSILPFVDALMITSRTESMTGVAIESVMAGCPVISYDLDGLDDLLLETGAGVLVPLGDEQALAKAITSMLQDADMREEMRGRARTIPARYSTENAVQEYDAFLRRIV